MSSVAVTWAYKIRGLNPGQKFVLITIADMADQEHSCFPGIPMLATKTEISESSVRSHLKVLRELELITVARRNRANGARSSNRYYLPVDNSHLTPESSARPEASKRQISAPLALKSGGAVNHHLTKSSESTAQVTTEPVDNLALLTATDSDSDRELTRRERWLQRRAGKYLDIDALQLLVGKYFTEFDRPDHILRMVAFQVLGKGITAGTDVRSPTAYVATSIKAEPEVWRMVAFNLEGPR